MFRRISLRARARVLLASAIVATMSLTLIPGALAGPAPTSLAITPNPINASTQHAVTVSGTATGVTAHITLSDADLHAITTDAPIVDGAFSAVLDAGSTLHDGTLVASVTVTDVDDTISDPALAEALMDTVAPAAGTLTFDDGDGTINAAEAQTNLPVHWDGPDDAASASVWFADVDGTLQPGCGPWPEPVDGTGALPDYCTPNLQDGSITFRGTWTDAAGNVGVEGAGSTILDRAGPAVAITAPADGSAVPTGTIGVTGTVEPGASVSLTDNGAPVGSAVTAEAGTYSFSVPAPIDSAHTLVVTAIDVVGNSSSATSTVTVDDLVPIIATPSQGSLEPGLTTVSGTGEPASTVEVFEVVGTTSTMILRVPVGATGTWSAQGGFHTGAHTIKARGVTRLGQAGGFSAARSFSVDGDRPTVAIDNADLQQGPEEITGTATDTPGVVRVELRYFNAITGALLASRNATCATCGPTATSVTWTDAPVQGLVVRVEAVAVDAAGQRSQAVSTRYIAP